ncbi:MAG TPA: hypothetical protein QF651_08750, partial [Acidimicrobiales bacterium]|nr:hypothetical protein [Acidimicrobiales bacterium]
MGTPGVGHSVKQLDVTSGQYSTIFSISANRNPSYTHLNGIGINPGDGALYGLMRVKGFGYLVRFDAAGNVAFVARVPAMSNAGDVDGEGTFVWPRGNSFYTLSGIAGMEGFADPGDAANKSQIAPLVTGTGGVADVAALRVDLGDGERPYAMGVNTSDHKLRIWAYDDTPEAWTINLVITDGSPALTNGGFGAAWSHEDRIYFSSNSGAGVYEIDVPSIDLNAKTADIRRVANSQATAINDGTTCIGIDIVIVDPPTDCTLQANWDLLECACPPDQTRDDAGNCGNCPAGTEVVDGSCVDIEELEVLLSAFAVEDDGFVTWVPSRTAGLQSYVLTWRPPSGSWTTHSSYTDPNSLKDTLVGLADGVH